MTNITLNTNSQVQLMTTKKSPNIEFINNMESIKGIERFDYYTVRQVRMTIHRHAS